MSILNPKYPIDKLININKELWRIAAYRNKYGHTPTYTLKYETSNGIHKTIDKGLLSGLDMLGKENEFKQMDTRMDKAWKNYWNDVYPDKSIAFSGISNVEFTIQFINPKIPSEPGSSTTNVTDDEPLG